MPQPDIFEPQVRAIGSYCANCGAARRLHHTAPQGRLDAFGRPALLCPERYRPTLEDATDRLTRAMQAGDPDAVFTARGDVQHLLDHAPGSCDPLCPACAALLMTGRGVNDVG